MLASTAQCMYARVSRFLYGVQTVSVSTAKGIGEFNRCRPDLDFFFSASLVTGFSCLSK